MTNTILSERMQAMADRVIAGKPMADIGTDHGFVPIALITENKVPFAVLSDINKGPLEKAEKHLQESGVSSDKYSLRLGGGLSVLSQAEVSSAVIAGMGGELIVSILAEDIAKSKSFERLVLQPRTRSAFLRKWLCSNGFGISEEILVREQDRICEIIVCSASTSTSPCESYDLPVKMRFSPLFPEFLDNYISNAEKVLESLKNSADNAENNKKIKEWEEKLCMSISLKKQ